MAVSDYSRAPGRTPRDSKAPSSFTNIEAGIQLLGGTGAPALSRTGTSVTATQLGTPARRLRSAFLEADQSMKGPHRRLS